MYDDIGVVDWSVSVVFSVLENAARLTQCDVLVGATIHTEVVSTGHKCCKVAEKNEYLKILKVWEILYKVWSFSTVLSDKNTKKEYKYTVRKVYVGDRSSAIKYM